MSTPQGGSGSGQSGPVRVATGSKTSSKQLKSAEDRTVSTAPRGPRKIAPVKVAKQRDMTRIWVAVAATVVALAIIGFAVWQNWNGNRSWESKANSISGIIDYRKTDPAMLTRNHQWGVITYKVNPPVGGNHNYNWQRCAGDVYPAQIANEHAVHSLEHGAVWVTYNPATLPANQLAALSAKVKGIGDFILMSPYPGLKSPISLQAWGYQLFVNNAGDKRINDFIKDLRVNASMEPGAVCNAGTYITATGTTPHDIGKDDPGAQTMPGAPDSTPGSAPSGQPSPGNS